MILNVQKAIDDGSVGIPLSGLFRGEEVTRLDNMPDGTVKVRLEGEGPHKGHICYVPEDCLSDHTSQ